MTSPVNFGIWLGLNEGQAEISISVGITDDLVKSRIQGLPPDRRVEGNLASVDKFRQAHPVTALTIGHDSGWYETFEEISCLRMGKGAAGL